MIVDKTVSVPGPIPRKLHNAMILAEKLYEEGKIDAFDDQYEYIELYVKSFNLTGMLTDEQCRLIFLRYGVF